MVPLRSGPGGRSARSRWPAGSATSAHFSAGRRAAAGDGRRARRGGGGELPAGRPAALRRLPRRAHRAAQPAPDHRRARARRSRCARPARWSRSCCSTSTACATSTSRSATPPATSCSPRWPRRLRALAPPARAGRPGRRRRVRGDAARGERRRGRRAGRPSCASSCASRWWSARSPSTSTPRSGVAVHPDHGTDPATLLQRADLAATRGQVGRRRRAALPPGAGVAVGAPARPRRRPAPGAGQRRARGLLPAQGDAAPTGGWSAWSAWPAGSTRRTARSRRRTSSRWPSTPASSAGSPRWCCGEGLRRCREWADAGRPLSVAVNLSARTLHRPRLPGPGATSCSQRVRGARPSG